MIRIYGLIGGFLAMLLMGALWIWDRRKRNGEKLSAGLLLQAAGFGFLPAAAVWNAFKLYDGLLGRGAALIPSLPAVPWLTQEGRYVPCRVDLAAALIAFVILCLWLIGRKRELVPAGDLFLLSLAIWAGIRVVTESFYDVPALSPAGHPILRYTACLAVLIGLAVWTVRREKKQRSTLQSLLDWAGALLCTAAIVLTSEKILTTGSEIGDFALTAGAALLMTAITVLVGADSRKAAA